MRLHATIEAYGTAEGLRKEWEERERAQPKQKVDTGDECLGPNCKLKEIEMDEKGNVITPHLDHLEFQMTSDKQNQNIHFDKAAMKNMLRQALSELDNEDSKIQYLNSNMAGGTDHYAVIKFGRQSKGINSAREK